MPGVTDTPSFNIHNGDGVTLVFPHTLFAYQTSQIKVYTVEGTDNPVDVTSSVTITLNASFIGGNVTFLVAPSNTKKVLIQREVPYAQEAEFSDITRYKETAIEVALNTLCLQTQQLRDGLSDAVKYLPTAGVSDARITAAVDGAVPIFSGTTGLLIPGPTADEIENAQGYALDAAAALAACQTIYDNFDDRYLGQKSSAPTVDNDGNALIDGALYYNTVDNKMYVYDLGTTTWLEIETNIGDGTVTEPKIATGAVTTTKIGDLAVTATKIADATITYVKMASAAIASVTDIFSGTASKLVDAATLKSARAQTWFIEEQQTSGTAGGTFTASAWQKRVLNTTVGTNGITGASLSSGVISLPAGEYVVSFYGVGFQVEKHKTRLRNTTAGTTLGLGSNANADNSTRTGNASHGSVRFTLGATSNIELQHYCSATKATQGFGDAASTGEAEQYAGVYIERIG